MPIGYTRVPVADGSQLLDPRLDALIGPAFRVEKQHWTAMGPADRRMWPKFAPYRP